MTTAGIEPEPTEPFTPPAANPRRATSGASASNTVPGPAKPRRAKSDPNGAPADPKPAERSALALLQLTAEVGGDASVVWQFVSDYLDLLDHRITAVETAISAGNAERAEVALLSLESTSLMVGADAIVRTVRPIRAAVDRVDFDTARAKLGALRRARTEDRSRLERARDGHDSAG